MSWLWRVLVSFDDDGCVTFFFNWLLTRARLKIVPFDDNRFKENDVVSLEETIKNGTSRMGEYMPVKQSTELECEEKDISTESMPQPWNNQVKDPSSSTTEDALQVKITAEQKAESVPENTLEFREDETDIPTESMPQPSDNKVKDPSSCTAEDALQVKITTEQKAESVPENTLEFREDETDIPSESMPQPSNNKVKDPSSSNGEDDPESLQVKIEDIPTQSAPRQPDREVKECSSSNAEGPESITESLEQEAELHTESVPQLSDCQDMGHSSDLLDLPEVTKVQGESPNGNESESRNISSSQKDSLDQPNSDPLLSDSPPSGTDSDEEVSLNIVTAEKSTDTKSDSDDDSAKNSECKDALVSGSTKDEKTTIVENKETEREDMVDLSKTPSPSEGRVRAEDTNGLEEILSINRKDDNLQLDQEREQEIIADKDLAREESTTTQLEIPQQFKSPSRGVSKGPSELKLRALKAHFELRDLACRKIQSCYRGYSVRKLLRDFLDHKQLYQKRPEESILMVPESKEDDEFVEITDHDPSESTYEILEDDEEGVIQQPSESEISYEEIFEVVEYVEEVESDGEGEIQSDDENIEYEVIYQVYDEETGELVDISESDGLYDLNDVENEVDADASKLQSRLETVEEKRSIDRENHSEDSTAMESTDSPESPISNESSCVPDQAKIEAGNPVPNKETVRRWKHPSSRLDEATSPPKKSAGILASSAMLPIQARRRTQILSGNESQVANSSDSGISLQTASRSEGQGKKLPGKLSSPFFQKEMQVKCPLGESKNQTATSPSRNIPRKLELASQKNDAKPHQASPPTPTAFPRKNDDDTSKLFADTTTAQRRATKSPGKLSSPFLVNDKEEESVEKIHAKQIKVWKKPVPKSTVPKPETTTATRQHVNRVATKSADQSGPLSALEGDKGKKVIRKVVKKKTNDQNSEATGESDLLPKKKVVTRKIVKKRIVKKRGNAALLSGNKVLHDQSGSKGLLSPSSKNHTGLSTAPEEPDIILPKETLKKTQATRETDKMQNLTGQESSIDRKLKKHTTSNVQKSARPTNSGNRYISKSIEKDKDSTEIIEKPVKKWKKLSSSISGPMVESHTSTPASSPQWTKPSTSSAKEEPSSPVKVTRKWKRPEDPSTCQESESAIAIKYRPSTVKGTRKSAIEELSSTESALAVKYRPSTVKATRKSAREELSSPSKVTKKWKRPEGPAATSPTSLVPQEKAAKKSESVIATKNQPPPIKATRKWKRPEGATPAPFLQYTRPVEHSSKASSKDKPKPLEMNSKLKSVSLSPKKKKSTLRATEKVKSPVPKKKPVTQSPVSNWKHATDRLRSQEKAVKELETPVFKKQKSPVAKKRESISLSKSTTTPSSPRKVKSSVGKLKMLDVEQSENKVTTKKKKKKAKGKETTPKPKTVDHQTDQGNTTFSLSALQSKAVKGIDNTSREQYLSPEDFHATFGVNKNEFNALPKWKRDKMKRSHKLF